MDYSAARRRMVENQIRTNRVTDPLIIEAMAEIPRELFVPETLRGIAYIDEDVPLGNGRYLMEPMVQALLLQAAEIDADDVVLEIGGGTGYGAAVIARMASAVISVEPDAALAETASARLAELDLTTVTVVDAPLTDGCPDQAPYDVIVFGGAISRVPPAIADQLAEGGRIVAMVAETPGMGRGTVFLKIAGSLSRRIDFDAATPYLPGFEPQPTFRF